MTGKITSSASCRGSRPSTILGTKRSRMQQLVLNLCLLMYVGTILDPALFAVITQHTCVEHNLHSHIHCHISRVSHRNDMNITCYLHCITLKKAIVYIYSGPGKRLLPHSIISTNALLSPIPSHFHTHMCGLCLCPRECVVSQGVIKLNMLCWLCVLLASCLIALVNLQEHNLVN